MESDPTPDPRSVHDEASFIAFVGELLGDRQLADKDTAGAVDDTPRGWQNDSARAFLQGALSWVEDSNFGRSQGLPDDASPWQRFAVFLYCGKIYE